MDAPAAPTVTANDDGTFTYLYEDLPAYSAMDGHEFAYTIQESGAVTDAATGKTTVTWGGSTYDVVINGYSVTNTLQQDHVEVTVTKMWKPQPRPSLP